MKAQSAFQLVDHANQDREAPVVITSFDPHTNTYRATCVVCGADETSSEPFPDAWVRDHWPVHRAANAS